MDQKNMDFYTPENGPANTPGMPPVGKPQNNGMSTAGMVIGIITAVLGWCCCPYLAFPCGIAGIVTSCLSRKGNKMNGKALAGLICSIVGIVGAIVSIAASALLLPYIEEFLAEYGQTIGSSGT